MMEMAVSDEAEGVRARGRRFPKHGEKGMRYGTRHFLLVPGQGLIAQDGKWHLVAVPSRDRPGWYNFKLYLNEKAPKNLFHVGVGPRGISEKREVQALDEYHPGRREWVLEQARRYIAGELPVLRERGRKMIYHEKRGWIPAAKSKGES